MKTLIISLCVLVSVGSQKVLAKTQRALPVVKNLGQPKPILPARAQGMTLSQRRLVDDNTFQDQKVKSENALMQNLNLPGIRAGVVVASPSQAEPNYFYHWIRDAAISFMQVQSFYTNDAGGARTPLQKWMVAHLSLNLSFQAMTNLAAGDGEPKFNVDGSAYQGPWGRPQNDGPALRAISFIYFLNTVTKENWPNRAQIAAALYDKKLPTHSLIKTDLEYVAHHWNQPNFDLWEEAYGQHFFTLMVQRRAMIDGASLARSLGDTGAADYYSAQSKAIAQALQNFWNPSANYIVTALNVQSGPRKQTSLDTSVLLASLYGDVGDGLFAPYDDRVLATLQAFREVFQKEYAINQNPNLGIAMGRYPEDTYDGVSTNGVGNPWFITTQAAAEVYYRTALHVMQTKQIVITPMNLRFYSALLKNHVNLSIGQSFTSGTTVFNQMAQALFAQGDLELEETILHRGADGSLSEQMNRNTGHMQGAVNLTWSHASYLSAMSWRTFVRNLF